MDEIGTSDEDSVNSEIQEACREVLGLEKEKTQLTIAQFYAPTPVVLDNNTDKERGQNHPSEVIAINGSPSMVQEKRPSSPKRPDHKIVSSQEKCVGNHYCDLDRDTKKLMNEDGEKETKTLQVPQSKDLIADISFSDNKGEQVESLENAKYCFSNKVKTNKAFLKRVKHDRTKHSNTSVTVANNYALFRENTTFNYQQFNFAPMRTKEGKSKYIISSCSPSHSNDGNNSPSEHQTIVHWKSHQTPSQAPLIALQRSKTIYKNQNSPGNNKPPLRNQHSMKREKHEVNTDIPVHFSHTMARRRTHPVHMGMPMSRHLIPSLPNIETVSSSIDIISTPGFSGISKDPNLFSANTSWGRNGRLFARPTPEIFYTYQDHPPVNARSRRDLKLSPYFDEAFDNGSEEKQMTVLLGRGYIEN